MAWSNWMQVFTVSPPLTSKPGTWEQHVSSQLKRPHSFIFPSPFFLSCSIPRLLIIPSPLWQSYRVYIGWCCQVILTDNPPRPRCRYSWKKNDVEEPQKGWVLSFKSNLWGPFMKLLRVSSSLMMISGWDELLGDRLVSLSDWKNRIYGKI